MAYRKDGNQRVLVNCLTILAGVLALLLLCFVGFLLITDWANKDMECFDSTFRYVGRDDGGGFANGTIFVDGVQIRIEDKYNGQPYVILGLGLCHELGGYMEIEIRPLDQATPIYVLIAKRPDGWYRFADG